MRPLPQARSAVGSPGSSKGPRRRVDLQAAFFAFASAWRQVAGSGSPETVAAATAILNDARRSLYRLLADEDAAPDRTEGGPTAG